MRIGRRRRFIRNMKPDSVRNAVNILTSITAVSVLIPSFIVSSERNVLFGKCREIAEKRGFALMTPWGNAMRFALCAMLSYSKVASALLLG